MGDSATSVPADRLSTPVSSTVRGWRTWFDRVRFSATIFGVLFLCFLVFVYFQFTLVSGLELDTASWRVRQFSFRRDPFTNYQLSGVRHAMPDGLPGWSSSGSLGEYSVIAPDISRYLTSPHVDARWDLVGIDQSVSDGQARVLVNLLSSSDTSSQSFWPAWSKDNALKAAILWPAAQDLVFLGLYARLPALFELALVDSTPKGFRHATNDYIQSVLLQYVFRQAMDRDHVRRIAEIALVYGDHPRFQEILNSSHRENSIP